jgi:peroxiredoxin Q/BCP
MKRYFTLLWLFVFGSAVQANPLAVGADAPKLSCKDQNGAEVKLEEVYAKGITLVYFFPKAATPG